ncbi:MAG: TPR end-of-group domain-containing protein, partial [Chitinophagales bacterium]
LLFARKDGWRSLMKMHSFHSMKYFLLAAALLLSCSHSKNNNEDQSVTAVASASVQKEIFETGKVIPKVVCKSNPASSFALYLPSNYDTSKKFPALIFFDPHAGGEFVVKKYQHLAEEFHFILIGSNDSKNGLTMDQTNQIASNLISDATSRFSTFKNISLAGFSGGAKVALYAAQQNQNISSLVYCGAAEPLSSSSVKFSLLGFAGVNDMNYSDVIAFDQALQNFSASHFLIEWNGKHEWPDSVTFRNAFYWLAFNHMRSRDFGVDEGLIHQFRKETSNELSLSNDVMETAMLQQKIISFLKGIDDVTSNESSLAAIEKKPSYSNAVSQKQKSLQEETAIKQQYVNAFQTRDLLWWNQEISKLQSEKDPMHQRLLGFISLACYSISNNAIQQNNFPVAEKMLTIYKLADPKNSDQAFLEACMYAKQGKNDDAIQSLQRAATLGLDDAAKITEEPSLQSLMSDARLQELLAKMK